MKQASEAPKLFSSGFKFRFWNFEEAASISSASKNYPLHHLLQLLKIFLFKIFLWGLIKKNTSPLIEGQGRSLLAAEHAEKDFELSFEKGGKREFFYSMSSRQ